ncbi:MAG TPA: exo-beta-N-acetylmuramidase NamZ domain-containing protein, partial [Planctomycetota bacterium]|nr:exo-beta-N-acetylmuramidase NamZ domain-containing protein [Planctomycetota bacterium]
MTLSALALATLALPARQSAPAAPPLRDASPESVGMDSERLARIDAAVRASIERGETQGAVVVVGRRGRVVFRKAFGQRSLDPPEPMTADTVFDLASLTKVIATAASVMALVEDGTLRLEDRVVRHVPEFASGGGDRDRVTIEQLLVHRAGLAADDPLDLYVGTPEEIFARKRARPLASAPGARFAYSDVGYEELGELVRRVSGTPLDAFAAERVFKPLGMSDASFRPAGRASAIPASRVAPTGKRDGRWMRGEVHDPRAFALGGVAGHAGLFATADDVARFCARMLARDGPALSAAGVAAMTRPRFFGDASIRAIGWDVATSQSTPRGDLFPLGSFGHTGFTGTSMWCDPTSETFVVLLTNAVHAGEKGSVAALRSAVASLAAAAITDVDPAAWRAASERVRALVAAADARGPASPADGSRTADVLAGVDVLEARSFAAVAGKRVALLTNPTGAARGGRSTIDVLASEKARAAGVKLVKLFAPEHGIRGALDEKVADEKDPATGLPILSLYGESRRPKPADLADLDAVVVDLQDAGCRFYTYLTTLGYLLEEAAKAKVAVVVLDRPDPIGADKVEGPLADADRLSFTAYHTIPVRTGMTIGELAGLFNAERAIGAALTVVPMQGYARDLWHDETGLAWINPSPNLRSVSEAALYPGVALLETTNVSVGRGTAMPFEVVGAPWIDGARLARELAARAIPGVRFAPTTFTPASSKHANASCSGVRITLVNRRALDAV